MTKDTGGSAFPLFDGYAHYGGMTLRDWFAGQVLQGMISAEYAGEFKPNTWSMYAYEIADAMLEERQK